MVRLIFVLIAGLVIALPVSAGMPDSLSRRTSDTTLIHSYLHQPDSLSHRASDTTHIRRHIQQSDSLAQQTADTTVTHRPLRLLGSIDRSLDSTNTTGPRQFLWQDYITTPSILSTLPQSFLRDMGSPGQPDELTLNGLGPQDVAILIDGRPFNDPIFGVTNINFIPSEYIDRIEYRTGPDAAAYALNGAGGVINIVTKVYDTQRPYSKIRYIQGSFDHSYSDGILTQNVARNWNVMLGFQHQNTAGRFLNSDVDAWNTREKIRWALADDITVDLSHMYNKSQFGLNGGVDLAKTPPSLEYDERQATLMNTDLYEKQTRHDVAVTIGGRFLPDTTDCTVMNAYYTTLLREYRDEENRQNPNGIFLQANHRTARYGFSLNQDIHIGEQFFSLKGSIERLQIRQSYFALPASNTMAFLSGHTTLTLTDWIRLGLFGAYQQNLTRPQPTYGTIEYGATGQFGLTKNLGLSAGIGMGTRLPWLGEWYWSDSLIAGNPSLPPVQHRTFDLGMNFRMGRTHLAASIQKRFLHQYPVLTAAANNQPLRLVSTDEESLTTASMSFSTGLWKLLFEFDGMVVPSAGTSQAFANSIPPYSGRAGLFFFGNLVGSLDIKMGLRANFSGKTAERILDAYSMTFIPSGSGFPHQSPKSIDALIIGRIGSAIITFAWENITSENYIIVPFYPMQDRNFRLSVWWEFLD